MTEGRLGTLRDVDARLLVAAKSGDVAGVKKALREGADVRAKDADGESAMTHAMGNEVYFDTWKPRFPSVVEALHEHTYRKPGR